MLRLPARVLGTPRDAPAHADTVQGREQAGHRRRPARRGPTPRCRRRWWRRRGGPLLVSLPGEEEARASRRRRG